jgi:uncharacterized protein
MSRSVRVASDEQRGFDSRRGDSAAARSQRRTPVTIIRTLVERHPVLCFYVVAFTISWGVMLLVVGGPGGIPGTEEEVDRVMLPALLALFAGPSLAAILLIGLVLGRAGFRELLVRMTRWRVQARWYAVALLTAPVLFTTVSFALSLRSPEFLPGILTTNDRAAMLLFGIT